MASLNFNWFGDGNFFPKHPQKAPCLAYISSSQTARFPKNPSKNKNPKSNKLSQKLDQFLWETETRPDFRQFPQVDEALSDDPELERKENPTGEEVEENREFWEGFDESPVVQFLRRAEEIADERNRRDLRENNRPYRTEDKKLWEALPYVPGPDGRPMPRKALKTRRLSDIRFWDFMRQFLFGLWGFKQRPYPPGRPIDVSQAIGYKKLERRYYDFIMRSGGWFYKDRLGRTRGPLELITLKTAWAGGIIDTNTFIWGEDMDEWAPIGMIYGMEKAIATWEVRLGAAATAFIHKLQRGMNPFTPLKGTEKKTYKELQEEAIESRRRDIAVLEANGGVWPGIRSPSHVHFLWASGSELTKTLEKDHMPNRWIPKEVREALQETFPELELRPWQILHFEQLMDDLVFKGKWYRPPLSSFTTRPPYIQHFNKDLKRIFKVVFMGMRMMRKRLLMGIPGFDRVLSDLRKQNPSIIERRKKRLAKARRKPEDDHYVYGPRLE